MTINLLVLASGIIAILFIDTVGAIASNKYKIDYTYLAFISFFIYFLVGFFGAKPGNLKFALLCTALVGFFDATIGWDISIRLSAYTKKKLIPENNEQKNKIILSVTVFAFFIGALGCMLGNPS